jgi:two-component system cell cycle sensor histidine kinase/response regulator CckA
MPAPHRSAPSTSRRARPVPVDMPRNLAGLVDRSGVAVIAMDPAGIVTLWNPGAEQLFGWSTDEVVGRMTPVVPEEDRPYFEDVCRRVTAGETVECPSRERRRKDGSPVLVAYTATPLRDRRGAACGVISIVSEVPSGRLRVLTETSDLVLLADGRLRVRYASTSAEALLGHAPESLRGRSVYDLLDAADHAALRRRCEEATGDKYGSPIGPHEYRFRHRFGPSRLLEAVIKPGFSAAGEPEIVINARDVTDRDLARQRHRESEDRYRALFDLNPLPMWVFDKSTLRFLAVNHAAVQTYGYSREEFLGLTIKDIRPPEDVPALAATMARDARGDYAAGSWRHRKKSGIVFDVSIRSADFDFAGRPSRLVLAEDVSAKLHLEEQLRQAQKMDALGRVTGAVAHDFNNVLFVISGYAEQLLRRAPKEDPSHARLEAILEAAHRAAGLSRQLLTFSRQDSVRPQVVNINALVTSMEPLLRRLLGTEADLVLQQAPELGRTKIDPTHLEQILMNFVVNARDAMPGGGRVTVGTANVAVDKAYADAALDVRPGPYVVLTVSDTGHGIPADVRDRIFEPFFTTKEAGRGTGLGLAIVYGIVKQAGGRITVYSEAGHGTTFRVYLPRVDADEAAADDRAAVLARGSETVLLVEDDDLVREITKDNLVDFGYSVVEARNAAEAADVLASSASIAVVMTDMFLGRGGSGRDVAALAAARTPAPPVIVMSGHAESSEVVEAFPPTTRFLGKPSTLRALLETIRNALDGRA